MIIITNHFKSAALSSVTYKKIMMYLREHYVILDHTFDEDYNIAVMMTDECELAYKLKFGNDCRQLYLTVKEEGYYAKKISEQSEGC